VTVNELAIDETQLGAAGNSGGSDDRSAASGAVADGVNRDSIHRDSTDGD